MIDDESAEWLLGVLDYQQENAQALRLVALRLVAGEVLILNCRGCGQALGVFSVLSDATHCAVCEHDACQKEAPHVHAA